MKNKNVILIHGCGDSKDDNPHEEEHWQTWVIKKLENIGIKCDFPFLPIFWNPQYKDWKKEFEKNNINKNTILVAHSCGTSFIVRWLGETEIKIKKLILVAPWKVPSEEYSEGENELFNFEINENIKNNIDKIIIFTSDNEEKAGKESVKIFSEKLDARIINLKKHGHYVKKDMGTLKFPELLKEILSEEIKEEFDLWNEQKKGIEFRHSTQNFNEREVWFLNMGKNVGVEQGGKGNLFLRPVLVYRKFSSDSFLGIPLTSQNKKGIFYHSFEFKNKNSTAVLSQIRLFDSSRLTNSSRYGTVSRYDFQEIEKSLFKLLRNKKEDQIS